MIEKFNALSDAEARDALTRCCGSSRWVDQMTAARPAVSAETLHTMAAQIWRALDGTDWREAFTHHPRIGDASALRKKFATSSWASAGAKGASEASEATLTALADGNRIYEERFGYIFIVCATGKSAAEMLALLQARLDAHPDDELKTAAAEQEKILHLRIDKLLGDLSA